MLRSIVFAITFLVAISPDAGYARNPQQNPDAQSSILRVKSKTVRIKLLDEFSGEVISNSDVAVSIDNGVRCIKAPCGASKEWRGRSDAKGYVVVPTNILQQTIYNISTPTHLGGEDRIGGSELDMDGAWVVELIPNRTLDSGPSSYRLKLVDAESNRPLINTQVSVSLGRGEGFEGKTNSLGYIFFPIKSALGGDGWVAVTGYGRTKIRWDIYKMKLEKQ